MNAIVSIKPKPSTILDNDDDGSFYYKQKANSVECFCGKELKDVKVLAFHFSQEHKDLLTSNQQIQKEYFPNKLCCFCNFKPEKDFLEYKKFHILVKHENEKAVQSNAQPKKSKYSIIYI